MRPLETVSWTLEFFKIKLSGPLLKAVKGISIETQTRQEDWSDIPAYIQHTAQSAPQNFLPLYNPSTRSQRCFPSASARPSTWVGCNSVSDNVTTSERSWYQISRGVWEERGRSLEEGVEYVFYVFKKISIEHPTLQRIRNGANISTLVICLCE